MTETLFALGFGGNIAAVDTTSIYPQEALALPKVGYLRALSAEGVLAMRPDLVLLGEGAGPEAAVAQIKASSVPVRDISAPYAPAGVGQMIREVGEATGAIDAANELAAEVDGRFETVLSAVPKESRPSVLMLLSAGTGPMLGAGSGTASSAMIELAGGRLGLPGLEGFRPVSLEPVLAADPDWLLLPSHVVETLGGPAALSGVDVIAQTNAGREGRIIVADSLYMLGFGPRTPQAVADLAGILHPEAAIPLVGRAAAPSGNIDILKS